MELSETQKKILATSGHLLVTGGPGSGKTTVSILKAAALATEHLHPSQKVLFLSFARATVSRLLEAIDEERQISREAKKLIEVDTYHSFFWRILKTHGYLLGVPRKLAILTPPNEGIALSSVRRGYKSASKLSDAEKEQKLGREAEERVRLAQEEGQICFNLFASYVGRLLHSSLKIRKLVSNAYPFIVLDEFQDASADQWHVVKALGMGSTLIALADPEQRIFDFIGADPARLDHFRNEFNPSPFDLSSDNHRSKGTDIATFGNDILKGKLRTEAYSGIGLVLFESNPNQALSALAAQTLQARKRLIKNGRKKWTVAILVPTKRMTRQVSDAFRNPIGTIPAIPHSAAVDMEAAILAAEIIAFLMQPGSGGSHTAAFVELLCGYFRGKGGDTPSQASMNEAEAILASFGKCEAKRMEEKAPPKKSIFLAIQSVYEQTRRTLLTGDPDVDWVSIRRILEEGGCPRLKEIALEVRNIRILDRGTQLRQTLSQDWRDYGEYRNALAITRQAFVHEHFATAHKPETGVVIMNMHKAKGKQFDEVVIFEGWPHRVKREIKSNPDRIVRSNVRSTDMSQARQNFRVSITRARTRTTIMTPKDDPCVLLLPES